VHLYSKSYFVSRFLSDTLNNSLAEKIQDNVIQFWIWTIYAKCPGNCSLSVKTSGRKILV